MCFLFVCRTSIIFEFVFHSFFLLYYDFNLLIVKVEIPSLKLLPFSLDVKFRKKKDKFYITNLKVPF